MLTIVSDEIKISKKGTRFCFSKPEHFLYFQYAEKRTWINDCKINCNTRTTNQRQAFLMHGVPTKTAVQL